MKRAIKATILGALRFTGVAALMRRTVQARALSVLVYHDPSAEVFANHLEALRHRYNIVTLTDVLGALRSGDVTRLPRRALLITLDDGWARNHTLIGPLEQHGVRPTIFITSSIAGTNRHFWWTHVEDPFELKALKLLSHQERTARLHELGFDAEQDYEDRQALSLEEMEALGRVADLQAHTRFHPILPSCTDEAARREIVDCSDEMERLVGERPRAFAYPNGDHSQRDVELVRAAGNECAFTVEPGYNRRETDPYLMHRIAIADDASTTELIACASGAYGIPVGFVRRVLRLPPP